MRRLLGLGLGRRLPITSGDLIVPGAADDIVVRRDGHGIPHVEASNHDDALFGLGFCMAQDRCFQLELLLRAVRGTVAQLLGEDGVPVDRLARRIGFRQGADDCLDLSTEATRRGLGSFVHGINAGGAIGLRRRPHEFVLLRSRPSRWDVPDVVGMLRLVAFLLASNWDVELVRLKILLTDGPEAVTALDAPYPADAPLMQAPAAAAEPLVDQLGDDLAMLADRLRAGAASNAWAVSGARSATGRPLLAGDPHLSPTLPAHWYLAHLQTPGWSAAGAAFVGLPVLLAAHNGQAAWVPTAGLVDNTDLVLERIENGRVFDGGKWVDTDVRHERISVRGGAHVDEHVVSTPNGPVVSPVLPDVGTAVALRATWLRPHPLEILDLHRAADFDDFRARARAWTGMTLNLVYADRSTIGWQLIGRPPLRHGGSVPACGWVDGGGWSGELLRGDEMPWGRDPAEGFVVAANHAPSDDPRLGRDWLDGLRARRISELLASREDWDVAGMQQVQIDTTSLLWRDIRDVVSAAPAQSPDARLGHAMLAAWDGRVDGGSSGATVFELFAAELTRRVVARRAPGAAAWALGAPLVPLIPRNLFLKRRATLLTELLRTQPDGWFDRPWPEEVADALGAAVRALRDRRGDDPRAWAWGRVRPLMLPHVLGRGRLARVFSLGPFPAGGDHDTVAQHGVQPADPGLPVTVHPSLRVVIDLADVGRSRFALPGGQSGNPASRHYADQLRAYSSNRGIPIPWHRSDVLRATRATLRLAPRGHDG